MRSRFAVAAVFTMSLAACGSNDTAATPEEAATTAAPEAMTGETPDVTASETPAVEASDAATPTPTPSAPKSAAPTPTPSPTPTKVAAAGPPEAFKQCSVCHSTEPGKTLIGPSLAGIYGEKAGAVPGYKFSDAMNDSGITWNDATLDSFLTDPKKAVPGTNMSLAGIKDPAKRADIIAYLKTL